MKVTIVGAGYVGLVTAAGFAAHGHRVTVVDVDVERVRRLTAGDVPIYEPGLAEALLGAKHVHFCPPTPAAFGGADVVFLAVGTPPGLLGAADLDALTRAAQAVVDLSDAPVVAIKSTVPVGTADRLAGTVLKGRIVFSVPEFLREGSALADFQRPDRVVIGVGADDPLALTAAPGSALHALHRPLVGTDRQILVMRRASAELVKVATNAMLASRISFMNELAQLAGEVGADILEIREGVGSDARIGMPFLYAGAGFGGSCFDKDLAALVARGRDHGVEMRSALAAREANHAHQLRLGGHIMKALAAVEHPRPTLAIWGLAFKPGTDDVRHAPAVGFMFRAASERPDINITAYDPKAIVNAASVMRNRGDEAPERWVMCSDDPYKAAKGADVLALFTEWPELRRPDFEILGRIMRGRVLFDLRNVWARGEAEAAGFEYHGVGRA